MKKLMMAGIMSLACGLVQAATPNPLMRPAAPVASPALAGMPPGMPPIAPVGYTGQMGPGASGSDKTEDHIKSAQSLMARYSVVAISGDTAVLRVTTSVAQQPAQNTMPGMPQTTSQSSAQTDSPSVLPSLVVTNNDKLVIQDVEVVATVRGDQVRLRTDDGRRAIYSGRLDGNTTRNYRSITVTPVDQAYTTRQSPPVNQSSNSTSNSSSTPNQSFPQATAN